MVYEEPVKEKNIVKNQAEGKLYCRKKRKIRWFDIKFGGKKNPIEMFKYTLVPLTFICILFRWGSLLQAGGNLQI